MNRYREARPSRWRAFPGAEAGDVGAPVEPQLRVRQVNVKLRPSEGADLDRAAGIYGVSPSTLARMLVNRGVKAILAHY